MASQNNSDKEIVPIGKAIAIIVAIVVGAITFVGGGMFLALQALNTKSVSKEQNITQTSTNKEQDIVQALPDKEQDVVQIPSDKEKIHNITRQFAVSYNGRLEQVNEKTKETTKYLQIPAEAEIIYDTNRGKLIWKDRMGGKWFLSLVVNSEKDEINMYTISCNFNDSNFADIEFFDSLDPTIVRTIITARAQDALVLCIDSSIDIYELQGEVSERMSDGSSILKNNVYYNLMYSAYIFGFTAVRENAYHYDKITNEYGMTNDGLLDENNHLVLGKQTFLDGVIDEGIFNTSSESIWIGKRIFTEGEYVGENAIGFFNVDADYLIYGESIAKNGVIVEGEFDPITRRLKKGKIQYPSGLIKEGIFDIDTKNLIEGKRTTLALLDNNEGNKEFEINNIVEGKFDPYTENIIEGIIRIWDGTIIEGIFDKDTPYELLKGQITHPDGNIETVGE